MVAEALHHPAIEDVNLQKSLPCEEVLRPVDFNHEFLRSQDDICENEAVRVNGHLVFDLVFACELLKLEEHMVLKLVLQLRWVFHSVSLKVSSNLGEENVAVSLNYALVLESQQ